MTRAHYDRQLEALDDHLMAMGNLVADTMSAAVDALKRNDAAEEQRLIASDNAIDDMRYDIEREALVLIATQQPLARDLRAVSAVLTIATELERIGDYCEGIAELGLRMASEPVSLSLDEIHTMTDVTQRLLRKVLTALQNRDLDLAAEVWKADDQVDELYEAVYRKMIVDMIADPSKVRQGTYLLWIAHNIERMADRVTNIAERVAFIVTGNVAAFRAELVAQTFPE